MKGGLHNPRPVDDTPVDGELAHGISSNWAFDHAAVSCGIGGGHITLLPWNYNSIGQGTWAFALPSPPAPTGQIFELDWENGASHAGGDNFTLEVYLAAGTYTLRLIGYKKHDRGILDIDIDAVEVASFDEYNSSEVLNAIFTQTGIVVATPGLKTITVRVDGKSGTNYYVNISTLTLWRTA